MKPSTPMAVFSLVAAACGGAAATDTTSTTSAASTTGPSISQTMAASRSPTTPPAPVVDEGAITCAGTVA